jgi:CheY-like chemotaxis protein
VRKTIKILIVDDHTYTLDAYSKLLSSEGHVALTAATGGECLRIARQERPDLIVMDVMLPDINGIELCRRIKAIPDLARTFIIHVSGLHTSPDDYAEGLEAGADGYLTKPIEFRHLLAQINALIRINENVEKTLAGMREDELDKLERLSSPAHAVTARLLGVLPLSESFPEVFDEIVKRYCNLIDLSLKQHAYKIEQNSAEEMHALAERLGFLRAGPRDVIDIHLAAMKKSSAGASPEKLKACAEEGRIKAIELMGLMVSYYRNRSLGINLPIASGGANTKLPAREPFHE